MSCLPTVNAVLHCWSQNANFLQLNFFPGSIMRKNSKLLRQLNSEMRQLRLGKALRCLSPIKIKVLENT